MKFQIALYFFMIAAIQFGLLFGVLHYLRPQNKVKPSLYWIYSLAVNALTLTMFGVGVLRIDNFALPEFSFWNHLAYIQLLSTQNLSAGLMQSNFAYMLFSFFHIFDFIF